MKKAKQVRWSMRARSQESPLSSLTIFVGGLLVGGIAGAATMLLFAPKSGRRTRVRIQRQYDELRDQVREGFEDFEEDVLAQAHHTAADARRQMKELRHHGGEMLKQK